MNDDKRPQGRHLVIGGSGSIGQELVRQLAALEEVTHVVATYRTANPHELYQHRKVRYVRWEFGNEVRVLEPSIACRFDGLWTHRATLRPLGRTTTLALLLIALFCPRVFGPGVHAFYALVELLEGWYYLAVPRDKSEIVRG